MTTISQVAATFAGFSGMIVIFRRGGSLAEQEVGALQVRDVAEISVEVALLALLPFIPYGFGASESLSWRVSSVLAGLTFLGGFGSAMRRLRVSTGGPLATPDQGPLLLGVALTVLGTSEVLLWLNVFGMTARSAATVYVLALLLWLAHASFMFVRLLVPGK